MSALHPLADLVALSRHDPAELLTARAQIDRTAGFDRSWAPAEGWVLAARRLPGTSPDPDGLRDAGLAFAQGRDQVIADGRAPADVAELLARRPERLESLPGDFGLIHVGTEGVATVVRSAAGLVPFYAALGSSGWTVATTLELILRFHPDELELDPLVNAIWTSGYDAAPDRRTFVSGVSVLGRGEYARISGERATYRSWWDPRRDAVPRPAPDHAERLRSSLLGTLERELDPGGENLLALSGGVDSSAVGALAAGALGREVSTLTVLPERPDAQARELGYIDRLDREVGFRRQRREVVDSARRIELLDEPAVPFHVLQPYLCLLRSTARDWPVTTLIGGEFADHTVGSTLTLRDWARHTTPLELWRGRRSLPSGPGDVRRWFIWRLQSAMGRPPVPWPDELPELVRPGLRADYRDWLADRRRVARTDRGPLPYLAMFLERQGFLGMHWEATSALGIRRCFPFVSRELLELAFELHPSELVGPGTKRLLRSALAGDVPASNLGRPDKGHPGTAARHPRPWDGVVPAALAPVLAEGWPAKGDIPYWDVFRGRQLVAFASAYESARATGAQDRNDVRDE